MRLLMVNDEVLTAETMKEEIPWEQYGIEQVYTAYDVEAGKECIRNNPVDIMLCDIEMPGENGLGTAALGEGKQEGYRMCFPHLPCQLCICKGGYLPGLPGLYPDSCQI